MQFERLRKSHKKQIIIGALAICVIGGALTFSLTRAKYEIANDLELAKGTINYKAYDFKIMAMYKSEDKTNYTEIEEMPSEGYTINESKSYCNMSNGNKDETAILKTIDGNHIISKLKKNDRCYLYFDKKKEVEIVSTILGQIEVNKDIPDFSKTAETDEGIFKAADGMYGGTSYYWRGAVTNNYVKFAGFCWRIMRINGDGSIRLIYDGAVCHENGTSTDESISKNNVQYNANHNQSNYVGWTYSGTIQRTLSGTASNAKIELDSWYSNNLKNYSLKITDGKYCNDREVQSGNTWTIKGNKFYYAGYNRMHTWTPTLSCSSGDVYTLKAGLITADEVMYAGGTYNKNIFYYLYNGQQYWTMTPVAWDGNYTSVYFIDNDDLRGYDYDNVKYSLGLRPVINLKADITFQSGGNGTQSNPYVVQ